MSLLRLSIDLLMLPTALLMVLVILWIFLTRLSISVVILLIVLFGDGLAALIVSPIALKADLSSGPISFAWVGDTFLGDFWDCEFCSPDWSGLSVPFGLLT